MAATQEQRLDHWRMKEARLKAIKPRSLAAKRATERRLSLERAYRRSRRPWWKFW